MISQIAVESRIKYGAQKFLETLSRDDSFVPEDERDELRRKVEAELEGCERKMASLQGHIRELQVQAGESSEAEAGSAAGESRDSPSGASSEDLPQRSIGHVPSSSTLSSSFHSSVASVPYPTGHQDALRRRAHSNATQASVTSADRNGGIVYTEPDQMSFISSSESGPAVIDYARAAELTTSPRSHMRQSRQAQVEPRRIRQPSKSQSRSRHGSSRATARPVFASQESNGIAYSLENMDALSRLANAVTSNNGIVRSQSISNESVNPLDSQQSALSSVSGAEQRNLDISRTHAEQEAKRQRDYQEALNLSKQILDGLDSLRRSPLPSEQGKYGLTARRSIDDTSQSGDDVDSPSAARRYASFMRKEAISARTGESSGSQRPKISDNPAKLIALLTRCIKMCPDILSELNFIRLVDV